MAANEVVLCFASMTEPELRQWVEANPGRVNDRDRFGHTPFNAAVYRRKSVPLILWLVKETGADVNAEIANSCYPSLVLKLSTSSMLCWIAVRIPT